MAGFTSSTAKVIAELSNGMTVECSTSLKASGDYREWYEPAPCEWMYGWTESEYEIDEETIEPLYPDEFEIIFNDTKVVVADDVTINKIIKIVEEPEWEVQEGWDDYDDYDRYCA